MKKKKKIDENYNATSHNLKYRFSMLLADVLMGSFLQSIGNS